MTNNEPNSLYFRAGAVLARAKRGLRRAARLVPMACNWTAIALAGRAPTRHPAVSYGRNRVPRYDEPVHGGMVKMQCLAGVWPNRPWRHNILYLGSSCLPRDWRQRMWLAKQKGALLILNQNGIASPSWCKGDLERINAPMRAILRQADYVFYQSRFCKLGADRFLGERTESCEILHNPIDTTIFTPPGRPLPRRPLILLAVGTINEWYRFEAVVRTLAVIRRRLPDTLLVFRGKCNWSPDATEIQRQVRNLLQETGVEQNLRRLPPFTQGEAPAIHQGGHILLHTQFNDSCPTVVLEALACGRPVAYSNSGGTPELVGEEAGIGVSGGLEWDRLIPPDPAELAEAVFKIDAVWQTFSAAARRRAVERFDVKHWIERHGQVFEALLAHERPRPAAAAAPDEAQR